jgi:hypothetical protein
MSEDKNKYKVERVIIYKDEWIFLKKIVRVGVRSAIYTYNSFQVKFKIN